MQIVPLVVERVFDMPASLVWKAITDRNEMKLWYFDLPDFRPEVGLEFRFWGGPSEDRQYLHLCTITKVKPEKELSHTWKYDGIKGDTLVTFELFAEGDHTKLRLTHLGLETFPGDNPDLARASFEVGWNWLIGKSLPEYLEKQVITN
jgi:uncharacterized protein YndB with AHSA1/START domain